MPAADKAQLRRAVLTARRQRPAADAEQAAHALVSAVMPLLAGVGHSGPVAAYRTLPGEPPTGPLLAALAANGVQVLVPVLLPDGDLDWAPARPDGMIAGPARGPGAIADCALVVVPALAVDRSGTRLGRGGGSYDRALARTEALTIAALYDGELVDRLPVEAHDVRVRAVVSPATGLYRVAPASQGGPAGTGSPLNLPDGTPMR